MANITYEGDLAGLSIHQLEFIGSVLQNRGFNSEKVIVSAVGKTGDGYAANIKRFNVEQNGATFNMIAKIALSENLFRVQMNQHIIFNNESVMYTEILPKFTELEIAANVPKNERLRYATCYGTITEEPNEIILLEDLQVSNFVIMDRMVSLTDDSVKLFLKSIATLHSLSYALKNQQPDTYEALKSKLINFWESTKDTELAKIFFTQMEENVVTLLDNDTHKLLVKRMLPLLTSSIVKNLKIALKSKYSIIQQGDSWTNNILFRLQNDKPVECCMIDYQQSYPNTPVADLQYMMFTCTDYETRAKHYHDWIDYYHSELDKSLANFGLKANLIYPRDQLDVDLMRFGKIAFCLSLMMSNVLMTESHESAKTKEAIANENSLENVFEKWKVCNFEKSSLERIKARIEGLITSFTELGYL